MRGTEAWKPELKVLQLLEEQQQQAKKKKVDCHSISGTAKENSVSNSSQIDPRGRPQPLQVVITTFTHVVRPSPLLKIDQNEQFFTGDWDSGLTEWIIDDSCLVPIHSDNV